VTEQTPVNTGITGTLQSVDGKGVVQSGWEGPGRVDECQPPRHLLVTMSPGREDETRH
jgi:hypothetical protein